VGDMKKGKHKRRLQKVSSQNIANGRSKLK
jgi:hypothetical protein